MEINILFEHIYETDFISHKSNYKRVLGRGIEMQIGKNEINALGVFSDKNQLANLVKELNNDDYLTQISYNPFSQITKNSFNFNRDFSSQTMEIDDNSISTIQGRQVVKINDEPFVLDPEKIEILSLDGYREDITIPVTYNNNQNLNATTDAPVQ